MSEKKEYLEQQTKILRLKVKTPYKVHGPKPQSSGHFGHTHTGTDT